MISAYSELPSSQLITMVLSSSERLCELGVCSMSPELLESWRTVLADPVLSESDRLVMCVLLSVLVRKHIALPVKGEGSDNLRSLYKAVLSVRMFGEVA